MKIHYKRLPLRPYPGTILLFDNLPMMHAKYYALTKTKYPYEDEATGGRYVRIEGPNAGETNWLIYGRKPHVLAHEFLHVLLQTFERCGIDPHAANGEPICYMLAQLMIEYRWK